MTRSRIRIGMVGGGPGAGIANAHRMGMRLDDRYTLVAGAFSRSLEKSRQAAAELHVDPSRIYQHYAEMAREEAAREDGIDVVAIVTPNDSHYPVAKTFLEAGIHVVCDKPMTDDLDTAIALHELAQQRGLVFALTHNYSAYAMVRHAAELVRDGTLGELRIAQVEHASGWAAARMEDDPDNKQAAWRLAPEQAGEYSVLYDLGTHAHQLLRFISGLEVAEVSAELNTCVTGRRVFDDAHVQLRLSNGARGTLWACMAATGNAHGLRIRLYGDKASLEWEQIDPHHLTLRHLDGRCEVFTHGYGGQSAAAERLTRVGLGHPEGFIESFANLYGDVAEAIERYRREGSANQAASSLPGSRDGVLGVRFVKAVAESHVAQGRWIATES